jgi:signal peptidase II
VQLELLLSAGLVLILDQLTKALVARRLAEGQAVRVNSWVRIRHVANRAGNQRFLARRATLLLVWAAAVGGTILATQYGSFFQHAAAQVGLGAALGGATGNLCDRLSRGAVIDFLDVGWWPVFNCADVAITAGAILALGSIR